MIRSFIYTDTFRKCWAMMGLGDDAIAILEDELLKDPYVGDVIQGTGGARKMRIQSLMDTEKAAVDALFIWTY